MNEYTKQSDELKRIYEDCATRNDVELYGLYSTCERAFAEYWALMVQAVACKDEEQRTELIIRRLSCRDVVIVFAHLFLEAVIYDFGAVNTSDSYIAKYVDKLDFLAKWVVVPRLVTGNGFPTDSHAYQLLGKLKRARNALIHFKTKQCSQGDFLEGVSGMIDATIDVSGCFECMGEVLVELAKLGQDRWLLFQWGFVKTLMEKQHKRIEEDAVQRIREAIGVNTQSAP